jgi:methionyl aminopeptidase
MILLKTPAEIEILHEGGKKLAAILDVVAQMVKPGISTAQLEETACRLIEEAGGRPAFKNYMTYTGEPFPTALCTSINNEVVHGPAIPGRILKDGDILSIDVGMEYPVVNNTQGDIPRNKFSPLGGYFTDMATTVGVGKISPKAQKLIEVTRESLMRGIEQVKPGNSLNDISGTIEKYVKKNGFKVVRDLVGHGVGHKLHEDLQVPNYLITDNSMENVKLKEGMVLAIEPMVNIGGWRIDTAYDGFTIVTADGSLSAHFEHSVAITKNGHLILTR